MKLTECLVTSIHAGDRIDLVPGSQGFYTVLSVRAMASHLLAYAAQAQVDESIELFVRADPTPHMTFVPKYVYFFETDTVTKIQPTES